MVHASEVNVIGTPGVMSLGVPPASGTVQISPPTEPLSLISPPMYATLRPSGETRGKLSWVAGFAIDVTAPVVASIRSSVATHQLLSPLPSAVVATKPRPSGVQSYS